jgi:hypothetical protein
VKIFGFEIKRASDEVENQPTSFAEPVNDDGAMTVGAIGGSYGTILDLDGQAKTESELVTRYRQMVLNPEIQQAVDEVVNEAISISSHEKVVEVVLDDVKIPDKVKKRVTEEFDEILKLLDFSNTAYDIFAKFYVDGRLNYHVIIDDKNIKDGIKEVRYLDPRKVRFVREMEAVPISNGRAGGYSSATTKKIKKEYYMYSESGFGTSTNSGDYSGVAGLKIAKDSIVRVTSGILNETNSLVLSHLHKAIKPLNQLRMLEDANVIYTLVRSPERRVFYIDVGNLPKAKAEQYLHDMMARHKNKVVYDPSSGEIKDSRKMMSMTEDYWFPRREGNRTTEIETLPSAGTLGDNDQLTYFQNKLYKSLNVPIGRLQPENMYSFGRTSEVTREELKFGKFVKRLRARFSILFDRLLERQLILKGVITPDEWNDIQNSIRYDFMKDNFFEELKEAEILKEKMATLREVEEHAGKYFSRKWIRKHVLYLNDQEIEEMQKEIDEEKSAGEYSDGMDDFGGGGEEPLPPPEEEPSDIDEFPPDGEEEMPISAEESLINKKKIFTSNLKGKQK